MVSHLLVESLQLCCLIWLQLYVGSVLCLCLQLCHLVWPIYVDSLLCLQLYMGSLLCLQLCHLVWPT